MRTRFILCFLLAGLFTAAQDQLAPVGQWREHLPYNSAIDLAAGNTRIFCATPYSLFSVTYTDAQTERFSRVTGLSETGVSTICMNNNRDKLLVAYTNSNLDILQLNRVYNIPDIKRDNIPGDKSIYRIYALQDKFYLASGLGVIVVDANRYEISDTWLIGNGGNPVKVTGFSSDAGFYYAATTEGLKKAAIGITDPADYRNWQTIPGTLGVQQVLNLSGTMVLQKNDSLFIQNGNNWNLFYQDGWPLVNVEVSENKLLLCERQTTGISRVVILDPGGAVNRVLDNTGAVSFPRKALLVNNEPWVADQFAGLSRIANNNVYANFSPGSPQAVGGGEMAVADKVFYATAGAVNDAWNYQYNGDGIFILKEGNWTNINRYRYPAIDTLLDYITLAYDKRDASLWAGSYGGGLLHLKEGPAFTIYKQGYLDATVGDPGSYRVAGLCFDTEQNLWVSNFGAPQPLRVLKADGSWKNFSIPFTLFENAVAQIIVDDNGYKWMVSPLGNGLIVFDHGNSIDNTGDDRWRKLGMNAGNGNLPSSNVTCLAKDKSGFIWVGTTDGVAVFQCPGQLFSTGCDAYWPIVPNGNFAGYLFKGEEVKSIAVDGADRKWVATKNGVFLVDAAGEKVLARFTETSSPLLSNDVKKITIDGKTGEVFFATLKGICSFRSDATEGGIANEDVLVFPNPVPPGYGGTIAIRGLVNNAIVKITELDGKLVYQTRALGGQANWDGKNYRGQRISSGVYLVLVQEEGGKERTAAKIFFINR